MYVHTIEKRGAAELARANKQKLLSYCSCISRPCMNVLHTYMLLISLSPKEITPEQYRALGSLRECECLSVCRFECKFSTLYSCTPSCGVLRWCLPSCCCHYIVLVGQIIVAHFQWKPAREGAKKNKEEEKKLSKKLSLRQKFPSRFFLLLLLSPS